MCGYSIKRPNKIKKIKHNNKTVMHKLDETKHRGQTNPNPLCNCTVCTVCIVQCVTKIGWVSFARDSVAKRKKQPQ